MYKCQRINSLKEMNAMPKTKKERSPAHYAAQYEFVGDCDHRTSDNSYDPENP